MTDFQKTTSAQAQQNTGQSTLLPVGPVAGRVFGLPPFPHQLKEFFGDLIGVFCLFFIIFAGFVIAAALGV